MTFVNSQQSRVAVGLLNASGYAKSYRLGNPTAMLDTTSLLDTSKQSIPGQRAVGAWSIEMMLDTSTATNGQFDVLTDWTAAAPYPITFGVAGFAVGAWVALLNGLQGNLVTQSAIADVVMANTDGIDADGIDYGYVLEDFTAVAIDATGTARDGGAASANGGVAHLHISAFSGLTSNAVRIEHSVDGSTSWATLCSFTTATGLTSERVVVAPGTTVRRYLRVVDDVTGTGTNTRLVAFARR